LHFTNKKRPIVKAIGRFFFFGCSLGLVAAAAEYHDQGKDDNPGAVVVKDMTKAVVVHSVISLRKESSAILREGMQKGGRPLGKNVGNFRM